MEKQTISIDDQSVPFKKGQTIMDAALAAGIYIPHLCHNPEIAPSGNCRLCTVQVGGRRAAACITPAVAGQKIQNNTQKLNDDRRTLTQMLFVEGNHICPGCAKTGNCQLQAVAYYVGMLSSHYQHFYPYRDVDSSDEEVYIDFNRCILCELCVRASRDIDKKNIFSIAGRGINAHLVINSPTGKLADTDFKRTDKAGQVCPVGAIMTKRARYTTPIGERLYDQEPISIAGDSATRHQRKPKRSKKP